MQEFYCKTKILSGENALAWLDGQKCESLLLVTDPYFMKNGTAQAIAQRADGKLEGKGQAIIEQRAGDDPVVRQGSRRHGQQCGAGQVHQKMGSSQQ